MSVDDLKEKTPDASPAPDQPSEKDEKKGGLGKLLFVGAIIAAGAIFLSKKFKGKFPNKGDEPMLAP